MKTFTFILPSFIELPRKKGKNKKIYLSMNSFMNAHFLEQHQVKQLLKLEIQQQLIDCPNFENPVEITFKMIKTYVKKEKLSDKSNFFAISSKRLYDFLTEEKKWKDDNDTFIKKEILLPTEHKKSNKASNFITFTITEIC